MNTRYYISFKRILALSGLFLILVSTAIAQESYENKEIDGANAVREEIQRYMGYEPLLPRYLTLPYDTSTNTNVNAPFVNIGYLFMALIPILFLFGFRHKPWLGMLCMFLFLALLFISVGNGKFVHNGIAIDSETFATEYSNVGINSFPSNLVAPIYRSTSRLYRPLNKFFTQKSGNADSITYPFLFLMFGLMIFLIRQRTLEHKNEKKIFILFISFFTFMWLLLTAGIIWYGYPMIAMSILVILSSINPKKNPSKNLISSRSKQILVLGSISIFVALGLFYRLSNYAPMSNAEMGKLLFDVGELQYQSGRKNKQDVLNGFFPGGFTDAIQKVNLDESQIYAVGTVLPFFVTKNDKRVFKDNQLQNFERLRTHYKDKNTLIEVLKSGGYKYIFVDLNTYAIDRTPEKTLVKKYREFMRVLYQNPKVALLATDRQINTSQDSDNPKIEFGVFEGKPTYDGKYAIFELL